MRARGQRPRHRSTRQKSSSPKVGQQPARLHALLLCQDVFWLHVSVQNALFMCVRQSSADIEQDLSALMRSQGLSLHQCSSQGTTTRPRKHQRPQLVYFIKAGIQTRYDVAMLKPHHQAQLAGPGRKAILLAIKELHHHIVIALGIGGAKHAARCTNADPRTQ